MFDEQQFINLIGPILAALESLPSPTAFETYSIGSLQAIMEILQ